MKPKTSTDIAAIIVIASSIFTGGLRTHSMSLEARAHSILNQEHRVVYAGPLRKLDDNTKQHSLRVAEHATQLAQLLYMDQCGIEEVRIAALLHDVGKVNADPDVLWFPGVLLPEQKEELHLHPLDSERIATFNRIPPRIRRMIRQHHEMVDGTGYPDGLKGGDIAIGASVIKVADEWDRMRHPVPWRPYALSPEEARSELHLHADKRYPANLVKNVFDSWYRRIYGTT